MDRLNHAKRRRCGAAAGRSLEPTDALLLANLERTFADAARRAGDWLVCGPGCFQCCLGPFPITRLDGVRLREGLDRVVRDDPERAVRIRARAREAVGTLRDGYPGDPDSGRLAGAEDALNPFFAGHATMACPVMDPDSGQCDLYRHRPVACRTYGPPLRHGDRDAPHCLLCFEGATREEVDRCRVEPDAEGLEQHLLAQMGVKGGDEWETLIAFAVLE